MTFDKIYKVSLLVLLAALVVTFYSISKQLGKINANKFQFDSNGRYILNTQTGEVIKSGK